MVGPSSGARSRNFQVTKADWIDEDLEESLVVYELAQEHRKKMKSTNMLEHLKSLCIMDIRILNT